VADLNNYISSGDAKVKTHDLRTRIHGADESELREVLKDCEMELFNLRTQSIVQQLPNPMRIRHVRKLIARVQTELNARNRKEAVA